VTAAAKVRSGFAIRRSLLRALLTLVMRRQVIVDFHIDGS
jgi:hypothetical protein